MDLKRLDLAAMVNAAAATTHFEVPEAEAARFNKRSWAAFPECSFHASTMTALVWPLAFCDAESGRRLTSTFCRWRVALSACFAEKGAAAELDEWLETGLSRGRPLRLEVRVRG